MALAAASAVALTGCSPLRPVFYPNMHYQQVGQAVAERDADDCMQRAEQFVKSGGQQGAMARDAAVETTKGAAFGGAVGAVGGAIGGNAAEGAAVGAATGATAGLLNTLFGGVFRGRREPDPTYANFVNQCLSERGYQLIGWQ
jgi:hypothetical protein